MRIFLTGASGFIGSAIVRDLIDAGHQVTGLARSDSSAAALTAAGAQVHRGDLSDPASLAAGAAAADGVIHCAFVHDFSDLAGTAAIDRAAITAIGDTLAGSDRPFVVTGGTALLAPGRVGTEEDGFTGEFPRTASGPLALAYADRGVRVSVLRLPPTVHGEGDHGFVPAMIAADRDKGLAAYIGDGSNRWAAVHRLDAARLFRLASESAPAGSVLHAIGEQGVPVREIAEVIGRRLALPVASISADRAPGHFGWLGAFAGLDTPASSDLTQKLLGWQPAHAGLIPDLDEGHYFGG